MILGFTMVNMKTLLTQNKLQDNPFLLAFQVKNLLYVHDPIETDRYVVLKSQPKGLRNYTTYEPEYVDMSRVSDFQETKCVDEENIVYVNAYMYYVHSNCEEIWLNFNK